MSESALGQFAVYTARPSVRINGNANERLSGLLMSMDMEEKEDGLSSMELCLSNTASDPEGGADFAFEDESVLKLGDHLTVMAGDEDEPSEIFSGYITGLEAEFTAEKSPMLIVLAEDMLQRARMTRKTQTYEDQSVADIARTIAQDLGLTPQITGLSNTSGTWVQLNESNLAFLRRLLARFDGDVQIVGNEMHVSERSRVQRGRVELDTQSQLRHVRVLADLAHQVNEVTLTGWDSIRGQTFTGRSRGADRGPGSGRKGADILAETLGRRNHHMSHIAVASAEEADAVAEAAFDQRQRRFVTASCTAEGNPAIRVGTHVTLTGLGQRFDNTYYVTCCTHRFDLTKGYETDFVAECGFLGYP